MMFAVSSPIPLPNPAAFEDKLLVKKKRQLDTPNTPKCPSTPIRSPYPSQSHPPFNSSSHLHSSSHQPRMLSFCFDLATDSPTKSSSSSSSYPSSYSSSYSSSSSSHSTLGISLTPNVHNDKSKGCLTELKRCNRSEQYTITKSLGTGSFGHVYHCIDNNSLVSYAMKKSRQPLWNPHIRSRCLQDFLQARHLCPHPHLTNVIDAWIEAAHVYTLMELCASSLKERLSQLEAPVDERLFWQYVTDIMRGVHHMHNHNMVHLDIKPENILVGFDSSLKLSDFGLSTSLGSDIEPAEGDKVYMAPELLNENFSAAADIFSVGITCYEMITGYDLPGEGQAWRDLRVGKITFPEDVIISDDVKNLIIEMMNPDPTKRPTSATILSHPKISPNVPTELPPRKKVTRKLFE